MSDGHDQGDADGGSQSPDVVLVAGPSNDGQGLSILRVRDDRVEAGELRPAAEGKPVLGELVKLTPRAEHQRLFDVEVLARGPLPAADAAESSSPPRPIRGLPHKGPPRVSTTSYRSGWDRIFGPTEEDAAHERGGGDQAPLLKKSDLN